MGAGGQRLEHGAVYLWMNVPLCGSPLSAAGMRMAERKGEEGWNFFRSFPSYLLFTLSTILLPD